ncbi:hypothetical protein ACRJ4B_23995 [Streptomyces sp. GTA36]
MSDTKKDADAVLPDDSVKDGTATTLDNPMPTPPVKPDVTTLDNPMPAPPVKPDVTTLDNPMPSEPKDGVTTLDNPMPAPPSLGLDNK